MAILSLEHISKNYPGVKALDNVSISFEEGEVHAIIGENGAGKSTFIKTISGAIRPSSGKITIAGNEYSYLEPSQAIDLGIAVVYQELIQFDAMTVADNIFLGAKKEKPSFIMKDKENYAKAEELLKTFNCSVSPKALIRDLSVANCQIVEIMKASAGNARIVIMDEPTASITVEEQKNLFKIIKQLKARGVTIIYISHRLEELFEICDRVSVLRDGKYIATKNIDELDKDEMIKLMVGRELSSAYPGKEKAKGTEPVLEVKGLSGNGLSDINFTLHKGEILGFAGLVGAGRTELMHLIYGASRKTAGTISMHGKELNLSSPNEGLSAGIGLIPEDRKVQGCFIEKPIFWNISISNLKAISRGAVINNRQDIEQAKDYGGKLRIKAPTVKQTVMNLSGGNQQKVVIAKVMAASPEIIIFDEPTRGIDIGARHEIYTLMTELTKQGKSILMVSSDMEELLGMSERIVVLHEGRQTGILSGDEISQEKILALASGM